MRKGLRYSAAKPAILASCVGMLAAYVLPGPTRAATYLARAIVVRSDNPKGEADIVTVSPSGQVIYAYKIPGNPLWQFKTLEGDHSAASSAAIAVFRSGEADIVYQGYDHDLWYIYAYPGAEWSPPKQIALPGSAFGPPAVAVREANPTIETDVVVMGPRHSLRYYHAFPGDPPPWRFTEIAGQNTTFSDPALAIRADGETDVVAQGPGRSLVYYRSLRGDPDHWDSFTIAKADTAFSAPSVAVRFNGEANVVVQGRGHSLWRFWSMPGESWQHEMTGGPNSTYSAPAIGVSSTDPNEAFVVAQGPDSSLVYFEQKLEWRLYEIRGARACAPPTIVERSGGDGEVDIVTAGPDGTTAYYFSGPHPGDPTIDPTAWGCKALKPAAYTLPAPAGAASYFPRGIVVRFDNPKGEGDIVTVSPSGRVIYASSAPGNPWQYAILAGDHSAASSAAIAVFRSGEADVVYQGYDHDLWYIYAQPAVDWSPPKQVALPGSTFGPPAVAVREANPTIETDVVVMGPRHSLRYYHAFPGDPPPWRFTEIAGQNTTFSDPALAIRADGETDVVAQGPGRSLVYYRSLRGDPNHWESFTIAKADTAFSAPAMAVRFNGEANVVVQGRGHSLWRFWSMPGESWQHEMIGGPNSTYSAPAIGVSATDPNEAFVVAQGADSSLVYFEQKLEWRLWKIRGARACAPPTIVERSGRGREVDIITADPDGTTAHYFNWPHRPSDLAIDPNSWMYKALK